MFCFAEIFLKEMPNYAQAAIQVRQNKERRAKGKDSQKPVVRNVNISRGEILRFYKDEKQVMNSSYKVGGLKHFGKKSYESDLI